MHGNRLKSNKFIPTYLFLCVTWALYSGFSWISFVGIFVILWLTWWKIYVLLDEIQYELSYFMTRNGLDWTSLRCRYTLFKLANDLLLGLHTHFQKLVLTLTESVKFRQRAPSFVADYFNNTRLQRLSYLENNHALDNSPIRLKNKNFVGASRELEKFPPVLGPISPIPASSPYISKNTSSFDASLSINESDLGFATIHKRKIAEDRMMSDIRGPGFSYKFLKTAQMNGTSSPYGLSLASPPVIYHKKNLPILNKERSKMMSSGIPATVKIATTDELCDTSFFSQDVPSGSSPKSQTNLHNTQKLLEFLKEKSVKRSFQAEEMEIDQNAKRRKRETSGIVERGYHSDYNFSYPQKPLAPMIVNNKTHSASGVKRSIQEDEGVKWNPSKLAKLSRHNEIMSTYSSLRGWGSGLISKSTSPKVPAIHRVFAKKSDAAANLEYNKNFQDENDANLVNFKKEKQISKDASNNVVKRNPMAVFSRVGKFNAQNPLRLLPDVMPSLEEFDLDKKREEAKLQKMRKAFRTDKAQGHNVAQSAPKEINTIAEAKEISATPISSLQLDSDGKSVSSSPTSSISVPKADGAFESKPLSDSSATLSDNTKQDKMLSSVGNTHATPTFGSSSSDLTNASAASGSLTTCHGVVSGTDKFGSSNSNEATSLSVAATTTSVTTTPVTSLNFATIPLSTLSNAPTTLGVDNKDNGFLKFPISSSGLVKDAENKSFTPNTNAVSGPNKLDSVTFPMFTTSTVAESSSLSSSSITETRPTPSVQMDAQKDSLRSQLQSNIQPSAALSRNENTISQSPFQSSVQASPSQPQSNGQPATTLSPLQSKFQPSTVQSPFQPNAQPSSVQSPFQSNAVTSTAPSPFQSYAQPSTVQSLFQSNIQPSLPPFPSNIQSSTAQSPFQSSIQPSTAQSPFQSNIQTSTIQSPFQSNIQTSTAQSPFQSNIHTNTIQSPFQSNIQPSTVQSPFQENVQTSVVQSPFQSKSQSNAVQSSLQPNLFESIGSQASQSSVKSSLVQPSAIQPIVQQSATPFSAVSSFQSPVNTGTGLFSFGTTPTTKPSAASGVDFGAASPSDSKFNFSSQPTSNLFGDPNSAANMFSGTGSFKVQNTFGSSSSSVPASGTFPGLASDADKKFSFNTNNPETSFTFGKTGLPTAFNFGSSAAPFSSEGQSANTFGSLPAPAPAPAPATGVFQFGSNNPPAGGFNFNPATPSPGFNFSGNISSNFAFGQQGPPMFNTPPMGGSSFNIGTGSTKSRPGSKARKSKR